MDFGSDNNSGVSLPILEALANANKGTETPYGADRFTDRVCALFRSVFEHSALSVFLVGTGTASNALALSALSRPWSFVLCDSAAHIENDEAGACAFFGDGLRLLPIVGHEGKMTPEKLEQAISDFQRSESVHKGSLGALSLTQATEMGRVYDLQELKDLTSIAHKHSLPVHMDGARFSNAVASLGLSPAEISWRAGVDALSFGATKNGALAAEAVIFFESACSADFSFRIKRSGHLFSKMRFFSAQFEAFFAENLWLKNAAHANKMARQLACVLEGRGIKPLFPVESNEVFVALPLGVIEKLLAKRVRLHRWPHHKEPNLVRLVASWETRPDSIAEFDAALVEASSEVHS